LLLSAIADQKLIAGGTTTMHGAYGQMVSRVGNATREAAIESEAQNRLLAQALSTQASVSGVNLDEEAANLQRYQQAYQAAGKVMAVAASLFETVLGIFRGLDESTPTCCFAALEAQSVLRTAGRMDETTPLVVLAAPGAVSTLRTAGRVLTCAAATSQTDLPGADAIGRAQRSCWRQQRISTGQRMLSPATTRSVPRRRSSPRSRRAASALPDNIGRRQQLSFTESIPVTPPARSPTCLAAVAPGGGRWRMPTAGRSPPRSRAGCCRSSGSTVSRTDPPLQRFQVDAEPFALVAARTRAWAPQQRTAAPAATWPSPRTAGVARCPHR
jgi:hypothetical protein